MMNKMKKSCAAVLVILMVFLQIPGVAAESMDKYQILNQGETTKDNKDEGINREDIVPGKVMVKYKTIPQARTFSRMMVQSVMGTSSGRSQFTSLQISPDKDVLEEVERLKKDPNVEYAEPVYVVRALGSAIHGTEGKEIYGNDEYYLKNWQWGLDGINVYDLWDRVPQEKRENITIAILDTGVDLYHEDLANSIVEGYDFINDDSTADDDYGHGTHVAGIAAGISSNGIGIAGVAGGSKIMPVKVLDELGSGTTETVISGINYAVEQGADVINLSLGSSYHSMAEEDAIKNAIAMGVVVVAATGNGYGEPVTYPAAYEGVIGVGAIDYNEDTIYKASFSNIGPEVDVVAPGVNILSTVPGSYDSTIGIDGYDLMSGTSMAAPFVAGMAALIKADNPSLTPMEIQQMIKDDSVDLGEDGKDRYYGYGLINGSETNEVNTPFLFPKLSLDYSGSGSEIDCILTAQDYNTNVSDEVYGSFDLMKVKYTLENDQLKWLNNPENEAVIDLVYGPGYSTISIPDADDYMYFAANKGDYLTSNFIFPNNHTITGTVSLPDGETAPSGGISVEVFMDHIGTRSIITAAGYGHLVVTIPEGESSASYVIWDPRYDEYRVGYYVMDGNDEFIPLGYYTSDGTVISSSDAEGITTGIQVIKDINLTLLSIDEVSDEEGNDLVDAQRIALDDGEGSKGGSINYGYDIDYFQFEVESPGFYRIQTSGETSTRIDLYNGDGEPINTVNGRVGTYYRLAHDLEVGNYYLAITSYDRKISGDYEVFIKNIPMEAEDISDRFEGAYPLAVGDEVAQRLDVGDFDYYAFTVGEAGKYYIETWGNIDTWGSLYDESESLIEEDDDDGYFLNFCINRYLEAGTYYIRVKGWISSVEGTYSVRIGQVPDDYGDTIDQAASIEIGQSVSGVINGGYVDVDAFKFVVEEGEEDDYRVSLSLEGDEYECYAFLVSEDVSEIDRGYYHKDGNNYEEDPIMAQLSPGTYYFVLTSEMRDEDQPYEFIIENQQVSIEDANLESAIREALEQPEGNLQISDLETILKLEAKDREITTLNGIQYLINLEELNLEGNNITDITLLNQLHNLYYLKLDHNNISDLSPLTNLTGLTELSLAHMKVTSISPLKNLVNLNYLRLNHNNIINISDLKGLINLKYLYLSQNPITSYSPVKGYYNQLQDKDFTIPSSSGGGGGGSTVTNKPLVEIQKKDGANKLHVKGIVDEAKAKDILKDESQKILIIDVRTEQKAPRAEIQMKANTLRMADEKGKPIKIETDHGSFEIKPGTLELGDNDQDVVFSSEALSLENIPADMKEAYGAGDAVSLVFDFHVTVDGKKITSFNKPITITIKVDMSKIKNKDKVGIYYYNEEKGNWEYVGGTVNADGTVTFETNHFSKYMAMEHNKTFSDILGHWAKDDIEIMAARHIAKGVSDDKFAPDAKITRAEFATLIVKALNIKESADENIFKDIAEGAWYQEAVTKAYKAGIVSGTSTHGFSPNDTITREQMATMIMKAYAYASGVNLDGIITTMEIRFNDQEKASEWARRNIVLANAKGFMKGLPSGAFGPKLNATRAQAVVVIKNLLAKIGVLSK